MKILVQVAGIDALQPDDSLRALLERMRGQGSLQLVSRSDPDLFVDVEIKVINP